MPKGPVTGKPESLMSLLAGFGPSCHVIRTLETASLFYTSLVHEDVCRIQEMHRDGPSPNHFSRSVALRLSRVNRASQSGERRRTNGAERRSQCLSTSTIYDSGSHMPVHFL